MSAGKIAAQSFQAAQRLFAAGREDAELMSQLERWQESGTCTRVRVALSLAVFARACRELPGSLMVDEGVTEVEPGSATCFATTPLKEDDLPRILRHKRMPVLNATVTHVSVPESRRRSSEVEQLALYPVAHGFDSRRLLAREAEIVQHRGVRVAEVAGASPAASSMGREGSNPLSPPNL